MKISADIADKSASVVHKQLPNGISLSMKTETIDSLLHTAILAEYNVKQDLVRGEDDGPLLPIRDQPLNEVERAKIEELVIANKTLLAPLSEDGPLSVSNTFPTKKKKKEKKIESKVNYENVIKSIIE